MKTLNDLVKEFATRKLADILYRNVSANCSGQDRQLLDWITAESFVIQSPEAMKIICNTFFDRVTVDQINYESFDSHCGRSVWDFLYQPIKKVVITPYTGIRYL